MVGEAFGVASPSEPHITIDIWSDVMCPFCYMGDALLEQALEKFPHREHVEINYHSYLLMPDLPVDETVSISEVLASKRGVTVEQAQQMNAQVAERGAQVGLEYRFDRAKTTNMRRAHELSHFAKRHGAQHAMMQRLFQAYFTDGENVGDLATLADLAAEVGLDRGEAEAALTSGEFSEAVEADLQQGQRLGISGVPFFVFDMKYAVSGAQPVEAFQQVLQTAWSEAGGSEA